MLKSRFWLSRLDIDEPQRENIEFSGLHYARFFKEAILYVKEEDEEVTSASADPWVPKKRKILGRRKTSLTKEKEGQIWNVAVAMYRFEAYNLHFEDYMRKNNRTKNRILKLACIWDLPSAFQIIFCLQCISLSLNKKPKIFDEEDPDGKGNVGGEFLVEC